MNLKETPTPQKIPLLYKQMNKKAKALVVKEYHGDKDCIRYIEYEDAIKIAKQYAEEICKNNNMFKLERFIDEGKCYCTEDLKCDYCVVASLLNDIKLTLRNTLKAISNSPLATEK